MASSKKKIDFDPYNVLSVEPGCSQTEIDKSYKKAALKWHPDKAVRSGVSKEEAEKKFIQIYQAYEFLKDDESRSVYDNEVAAKKLRKDFEDKRKAETSARRQMFLDKLAEREQNFENRKRKTPGSAFNLDKELEKLRREGAEYLARANIQKAKPKTPEPTPSVAKPIINSTIYNMSAQGLKDLEEAELAGL